jgi:cytochrome c peroxidase
MSGMPVSRIASALLLLALARLPSGQEPTDTKAPPAARFESLTHPPHGLPSMPLPDPTPTRQEFELGRRLFHDPILSRDRTVSCSSCHPADLAFASAEPRPRGIDGRRGRTHAPALVNRGYGTNMRWNGGSTTLEAFVLEPIEDPLEMDLPLDQALERLRKDPGYAKALRAAYGDGATEAVDRRHVARALATFVRSIVSGDAPVDRFHSGDAAALSPSQRTGLWLFESKAGCWQCHSAPLFTDESFHNTGVGVTDGRAEPGRMEVTGDPRDRGRFKTPTLRALTHTAPYMHDGSMRDLGEVVDFYMRGGNANPDLDPQLRPFQLTPRERQALIDFLDSL